MNQKKVLVVEDEKPMAMALEIKLKKVGLNAKAVFDGEEAIKALEAENYDLVLLDIMMPVLDGWGVLEKVKSKGIKTKIIITSNLSQEEDKKRATDLGASGFIVKSDTSLTDIAKTVLEML